MFDRLSALGIAALLASCATGTGAEDTASQENELSPELAALVAQPQTGSFNPEAQKDAAFFKDTPQ